MNTCLADEMPTPETAWPKLVFMGCGSGAMRHPGMTK